jgi:hypothetical protein
MFRLQTRSKGFHQRQRRFFARHRATDKMLQSAPAIENPGAFRTGGNVLLYIPLRFDWKGEIQVCI